MFPFIFPENYLVLVCQILCKTTPTADLDKPLGLRQIETPRITKQPAHQGDKVVSRTHRSPLQPRKYSWYKFLLEAESTVGHSAADRMLSMKNYGDPLGG